MWREISANFEELGGSIAAGCPASGENRFAVVGPGGLPVTPYDALNSWYNTARVSGVVRGEGENQRIAQSLIIEATGWKINQNGQVELVANEKGADGSPWNSRPSCGV